MYYVARSNGSKRFMKHHVYFEPHSSSTDNERGISSGDLDPPLSEKGEKQAEELGTRYRSAKFFVVYCSDLHRSFQTAEIAFSSRKIPIIHDRRLREWNYGQCNGYPSVDVEQLKISYIHRPFPDGESLEEAYKRVCGFLRTITDQNIVIIGHRATYYTLEHLSKNTPLEELVQTPWRWQPGWHYCVSLPDTASRTTA